VLNETDDTQPRHYMVSQLRRPWLEIFLMFLMHARCSHPSHPPWIDHPNVIWWRLKAMKLLITHFSLTSCYFLSLTQMFTTAPCLQTPPICVPPLV